jgi:predicted transcriptional regulator
MSTSATPFPSDKEAAAEVVARQPEDASFQSILRELAYAEMVRRGLVDSDAGRTVPDAELRRRISSWRT